jgi:hypothetical protein
MLSSCEKVENCNCGEYIGRDYDVDTSISEFAIIVINDCTNNSETFIVDREILNYAEMNDGRFCTGVW